MRVITLIALLFIMGAVSGCGSVISKGLLKEVDRSITIGAVQPERYTGRKVVWGGVIIASENLERTTEIEVLETRLSWGDIPADPVENGSGGRFIIEAAKYLDTAIFAEGKFLTVAGTVKGVTTRKIGMMDYPYPVITPIEIKLLEPPREDDYRDPLWYDPFSPPYYYGQYPPWYHGPPPISPWYPGYPYYRRRYRRN